MVRCQDGAAPDIPWLKWRVDGLWRSIERLERRFESLAAAVGMDSCTEDKLNRLSDRLGQLENLHSRMSPRGLSLEELDTRLEKHMTAVERVCSRIYVERVHDQLKDFFDMHVRRLDGFCAQLRAEAVCVHEKHLSDLARSIVLNLDLTNSSKLEKKTSSDKYQHQEASAEDIPTDEMRRCCTSAKQLHPHPGFCHKAMPTRRCSSEVVNDFIGGSAHKGDCTDATAAAVPTMKIAPMPQRRASVPTVAVSPQGHLRARILSHDSYTSLSTMTGSASIVSASTASAAAFPPQSPRQQQRPEQPGGIRHRSGSSSMAFPLALT